MSNDGETTAATKENSASGVFSWIFGILGTVCTCLALVSLVQHTWDVGLKSTFLVILESYRRVVHPPAGWLLGWPVHWFPNWDPPGWLRDMYALSWLGSAILTPALRARYLRDRSLSKEDLPYVRIVTPIIGVIEGATFIGLFIWVSAFAYLVTFVMHFRRKLRMTEDEMLNGRAIFRALAGAVAGTVAFFALNAFSPS